MDKKNSHDQEIPPRLMIIHSSVKKTENILKFPQSNGKECSEGVHISNYAFNDERKMLGLENGAEKSLIEAIAKRLATKQTQSEDDKNFVQVDLFNLEELKSSRISKGLFMDEDCHRRRESCTKNNEDELYEDLVQNSEFIKSHEGGHDVIQNIEKNVSKILKNEPLMNKRKSKVSKWTRVKAAFRWERVNIAAAGEEEESVSKTDKIELASNNSEAEARCLPVPSTALCIGINSTEIAVNSSPEHGSSKTGSSDGINQANSMDDIKNFKRNTLRRNSANSKLAEREEVFERPSNLHCSNKQLLRNGIVVTKDFEVLPETIEVSNKMAPIRPNKLAPSPLNLNQQTHFNDLEEFDVLQRPLKSPKKSNWPFFDYNKVIHSQGNYSSLPSSPSRLSDRYTELESEELSSGDNHSDPSTPRHILWCGPNQDEIHKRYELLQKKLDLEFQAKRRKWNKLNSKSNQSVCKTPVCTFISSPKIEEMQPNREKLLEESLSPDFKKKLQKWRVKKQSAGSLPIQLASPCTNDHAPDLKLRTDRNLWPTKLEGPLCSRPDEKDLPEKFQKKIKQWNKIKKSSSMTCSGDVMMKPTVKYTDVIRRTYDDIEANAEEDTKLQRDKLEKLPKIHTLVFEYPAQEVNARTPVGVTTGFEGFSRKFTRKLYEWEKAKGIGPESSAITLLKCGYCPLIGTNSETKTTDHNGSKGSLSRSLSLNSITANCNTFASLNSQLQASSLSLDHVNNFKDSQQTLANESATPMAPVEYRNNLHEPEAVIVEVEDHIVETATSLITSRSEAKHQIAVSKYQDVTCADYCNSKQVQSYESQIHLSPLPSSLKRTQDFFNKLLSSSAGHDIESGLNDHLSQYQSTVAFIRNIYPKLSQNLMNTTVLEAASDLERELTRLEMVKERLLEGCGYLKELEAVLKCLQKSLETITNEHSAPDYIRDISITSDDGLESSVCATYEDTNSREELETSKMPNNTLLPRNSVTNTTTSSPKKKLRARKMGSRQNSKTDSSDSSSNNDDQSMAETPRRWKRKTNWRLKPRLGDDDSPRKADEADGAGGCDNSLASSEDVMYVLQSRSEEQPQFNDIATELASQIFITPRESCVQLMPLAAASRQAAPVRISGNESPNSVFVKTSRKIFKTVMDANRACGIVVVEVEDASNFKPATSLVCTEHELQKDKMLADQRNSPTKSDDVAGSMAEEVDTSNNLCKQESVEQKLAENFDSVLSKSEQELPPIVSSSLSRRSLSWHNINCVHCLSDVMRIRSQSSESLENASVTRYQKTFRPPLAADSFRSDKRVWRKDFCRSEQSFGGTHSQAHTHNHRFKKNTEKFHNIFKKSSAAAAAAAAKRIEAKLNKAQIENVPSKMETNNREAWRAFIENPPILTENKNLVLSYRNLIKNNSSNQASRPWPERIQRWQKARQDFFNGYEYHSTVVTVNSQELLHSNNDAFFGEDLSEHAARSLSEYLEELLPRKVHSSNVILTETSSINGNEFFFRRPVNHSSAKSLMNEKSPALGLSLKNLAANGILMTSSLSSSSSSSSSMEEQFQTTERTILNETKDSIISKSFQNLIVHDKAYTDAERVGNNLKSSADNCSAMQRKESCV